MGIRGRAVRAGNVSLTNLKVLKAILYVAEAWRDFQALRPRAYDLYAHESMAKCSVLDRVFEQMQMEQIYR